MLPVMKKFDPDSDLPAVNPITDEERWRRLFENIRRIALKKSDDMINDLFAPGEEFDRDARILRMLMGSVEIAERMKRVDEKEKRLNDERPEPRAYTDAEIRTLYRRVAGYVDDVAREDRARSGAAGADESDIERNAGRSGGEGLDS